MNWESTTLHKTPLMGYVGKGGTAERVCILSEKAEKGTENGLRLFEGISTASFLSRPNRFTVRCEQEGRVIRAFLPNPGRLLELLLPGCRLYLVEEKGIQTRKTDHTVVAVERADQPIMLHTHRTNDVARYLLEQGKVPGLEETKVIASEVKVGSNRFDFLLEHGREKILLEVKSCTLFGNCVAMFPDAVTKRGARHLRELAVFANKDTRGAVLFVIHWPHARVFMPDYHTDLAFARTLLEVRHKVQIVPVSVGWRSDLSLSGESRLLRIPWDYIEQESKDGGSYLLILHLRRSRRLSIGRLGRILFPPGYYIYVGSAMKGLDGRIKRHRRLRKRPHWHIDALRAVTEFRSALPIRSSDHLECEIGKALTKIGEWEIPGFGSTDCACQTHLFGFTRDPLNLRGFHDLLQHFRMNRYRVSV